MLEFIRSRKECTGCGACYSICPVKCISMLEDDEGFLYPKASDSCINCGLCRKVCPIASPLNIKSKVKQNAIGFRTSDYNLWKQSSSGGAFSEIVNYWSDSNTIVFGAAWQGMNVHHIAVPWDNLEPLRKSKYISSDTGDTFIKVKDYLKQGKKIIYSGCPCQIAGLKSFLKREYDNLLTIDLICHGQGSKKVFEKCLKDTEELLEAKIKKYEFRTKRKSFETEYLSKVTTDKGDYFLFSERYTQLFLSLTCVRPSCGINCLFHSAERISDITLADFKSVELVNPYTLGFKYNYSTVIANSDKGHEICDYLRQAKDTFETSLEDVVKYNPNFSTMPTGTSLNKRNEFFGEFIIDPMRAITSHTTPTIISNRNFLWRVYDSLSETIRRNIIIVYRTLNKLKK